MNLFDKPDLSNAMDLSDFIPATAIVDDEGKTRYTHHCLQCDSNIWQCLLVFEDFEAASYMTVMECAGCGSRFKAPTPIDHPSYSKE